MIEPRLYRSAFIPALLALVLVMFSFERQPSALPQGLAADVLFDGDAANATLRGIVERHPDRRPGTPGDAAVARQVAEVLSGEGFETRLDSFDSGGRALVNVLGRRPGAARGQIVVMAARDASTVPDATTSAADTAALLELARVLSNRASTKTLVLASVDGSALGEAGARRLAQTIGDREPVDGVLVISNLGASQARGPLLVEWSRDASRGSIGLRRTAAGALRQELGVLPGQEGAIGQLIRLAAPVGVGGQGVLLEQGFEAIRLSGSGELPPAPADRGLANVEVERLGDLGRAALRTLATLDSAQAAEPGPPSYLVLARQVLPGWSISVLALALILPALVASVDAFARARRRRERVRRWWGWVLAGSLPFVAALAAAWLLGMTGAVPGGVEASPGSEPPGPAAAALLVLSLLCAVLVWLLGRSRSVGGRPTLSEVSSPGAACATALVLSLLTLLTWVANPFAALLLVPTVHLWMLAVLWRGPRQGRTSGTGPTLAVRTALVLGGLVGPAGVIAFYMQRLSLGPIDGIWYGYQLLASGRVGLAAALIGCVFLGVLWSVVAILVAGGRQRSDDQVEVESEAQSPGRVRGPGSHAGPGSLGGTESALRR